MAKHRSLAKFTKLSGYTVAVNSNTVLQAVSNHNVIGITKATVKLIIITNSITLVDHM